MVSELIRKYIWLVQTFIKAGARGLLLEDIQRAWQLKWDSDYTRRTFNNHREAIDEIFGIEIKCDRSTNRYFLPDSEIAADSDATEAWLINTFTINNLLALGKERLSGRVAVEDIPSGQRWLTVLMDAMTENREVLIKYRKYTSQDEETRHVKPYALKEFARRWYLAGWSEERGSERVYALDRILSIEQTDQTFKMPADYNVDDAFDASFGIYLPEEGQKAERIIFQATELEARYLRDLPLHHSQTEIRPGIFQIRVLPTTDVVMEFCRLGDRVEVLEPDAVREQIKAAINKTINKYQ